MVDLATLQEKLRTFIRSHLAQVQVARESSGKLQPGGNQDVAGFGCRDPPFDRFPVIDIVQDEQPNGARFTFRFEPALGRIRCLGDLLFVLLGEVEKPGEFGKAGDQVCRGISYCPETSRVLVPVLIRVFQGGMGLTDSAQAFYGLRERSGLAARRKHVMEVLEILFPAEEVRVGGRNIPNCRANVWLGAISHYHLAKLGIAVAASGEKVRIVAEEERPVDLIFPAHQHGNEFSVAAVRFVKIQPNDCALPGSASRSEEHTSELQSPMY